MEGGRNGYTERKEGRKESEKVGRPEHGRGGRVVKNGNIWSLSEGVVCCCKYRKVSHFSRVVQRCDTPEKEKTKPLV